MKTTRIIGLATGLAVLAALTAQATLYSFNFTGINAAIPDDNPAGWTYTIGELGEETPVGRDPGFGTDNRITDVNVRLNISGGYNGDLYGYLVHGSGFAVLLNRVGQGTGTPGSDVYLFGFSRSGFGSITLDQGAGTSIHAVEDPANGTYRPDSGTQNSGGLNAFNGLDPNGSWTLFLADLGSGETSTLVSWGLDITAVPEPTTWALIGFGLIFGGVTGVRVIRARRRACPQ